MALLTASYVIDGAALILQDETFVRWSADELLRWYNDGVREVVTLRPDAYPTTQAVALAEGTRQTLPTHADKLIRITRNMGTGGTTPGRAIRQVDMASLDAQQPDWHTDPAKAEARHFMVDVREPRTFYVYPANTGTGYVEMTYSTLPPVALTSSTVLSIPDSFANALLDYVLFRAFSKDGEHPANASRAVAHRQSFENSLGLKAQADGSSKPVVGA